jgi:hypothetical protein
VPFDMFAIVVIDTQHQRHGESLARHVKFIAWDYLLATDCHRHARRHYRTVP